MGFLKNVFKNVFLDGVKKDPEVYDPNQEWQNIEHPGGFSLQIGGSTGLLSQRGHASGILSNQIVWLTNDDACQNIIVTGGIGAGKTTRVINPLLWQVMHYPDVGGLIFDVKGDFKKAVYSFSQEMGKPVITIGTGPGARSVNLLKGLTPEQAASFLQNAFFLCGGSTNDSFWIQSATDLCRNALGILAALGEQYYSLEYLYLYVFVDGERDELNKKIDALELDPVSREMRLLNTYKSYYENVFNKLDIKMRESIKGTLSTVLAPFQNPDLIDAFSGGNDQDYDFAGIINGDIVLIDLPLAVWGTGAKVIYTMLKLRFFNLLQMRQADPTMPQNYVVFIADEYQNLASASRDGLSDLSFWDKSRSAHCCGIISTQSVSSFRAAIHDNILADTILQNFRQKIFFRTEDKATLQMMNDIAGKVEVERQSSNYNKGTNRENTMFTLKPGQTNESYSVNTAIVERQVIDANLVRQLTSETIIALLNIEGSAADDVLIVWPRYV